MSPRLLRPLATGFNPRSIAGLAAWWDSTDNSTITTDTGVSAWVDKANGYTLSQDTGANQPTLSAINGKQAFDYNGSTQHLLGTDAGLIAEANGSAVNDTTIFYITETDTQASQIPVGWASTDSNTPTYTAIRFTDSTWSTFYRPLANVIVDSGVSYSTGTPYLVSTLTGNRIVGRVNGADVVDIDNNAAGDAMAVTRLGLGAYVRSVVVAFLDGRIGDVLIYNRVLTTAEIQKVEGWLAGKFGVTLA